MKRRIVACLATVLLALAARPGAAQQLPAEPEPVAPPRPAQEVPPGTERVPSPTPAENPPPAEAPTLPPGCGVRVLWLDHWVPVERLVPREVITEERRPSLEVAYREEKRTVIETVLKSREVERLVPCAVLKPVTETCAETGQCTTVWKPCTEMKPVKELEYYAVPEPRTIVVQVPFVRAAEVITPRRTILIENLTIMQKCPEAMVIPGPTGRPDRYELVPRPCHDEHPQ